MSGWKWKDLLDTGNMGKQATCSTEQVKTVVDIAREMSLDPATPDETRENLGLRGLGHGELRFRPCLIPLCEFARHHLQAK